jgi:hypothetical protein
LRSGARKSIPFCGQNREKGCISAGVGPALGRLGVEGKYVDDRRKQESLTVKAQFGRGVLATRSIFDISDDVWAVPAGILAWLINE